jgi:ParB family chromosome partitioning protein
MPRQPLRSSPPADPQARDAFDAEARPASRSSTAPRPHRTTQERPDAPSNTILSLDASWVLPSPLSARHASSFLGSAFLDFKDEIGRSGGNVVPVLVRPLAGRSQRARYELVYGHRRHLACQQLGLPLRAIVRPVSSQEAIQAMHAENDRRKDLSAFERGAFYENLLRRGLYRNQRHLSQALGVCAGDISRMRFLATLSPELIALMQSPLDLAIHDADLLRSAMKRNSSEVMRRAAELAENDAPLPARAVVRYLTAAPQQVADAAGDQTRMLRVGNLDAARLDVDHRGHVTAAFLHPLADDGISALEELLTSFLRNNIAAGSGR